MKMLIEINMPDGFELMFKSVSVLKQGTLGTKEGEIEWLTQRVVVFPTRYALNKRIDKYVDKIHGSGIWAVPVSIIRFWARRDCRAGARFFKQFLLKGGNHGH